MTIFQQIAMLEYLNEHYPELLPDIQTLDKMALEIQEKKPETSNNACEDLTETRAFHAGYQAGYENGKRDAFKRESYKFAGGSELFTMAGEIGCEVRFRTPSYEKFRAAEEACRRVLDGKENEDE